MTLILDRDDDLDPDRPPSDPRLFPHFSASRATMRLIHAEMEAQRMLDPAFEWKLGSNSGFHVTADEVSAALAAARLEPLTLTDADGRALWQAWLEFLRASVAHGGVRVY